MPCHPALRDRPFLSDRYFFLTVRLLKERPKLTEEGYNKKVEYIHMNPVRAGPVRRPQDWSRLAGSTINEYSGMSAEEQKQSCGLTIDRVSLPSDPQTRI